MPRAASRRPATQPPVSRHSVSTCWGASPDFSSRTAACCGVKDICAARSSHSRPSTRNRGSDNGGSRRLDNTSRTVAGLVRVKICSPCNATGSTSSCTLSRTRRIGLRQLLQGLGELGEELRLGIGPPDPRGMQPARSWHRRAGRDGGHDGRPQPPRIVVVAVDAHPGGVVRPARLGPVGEQGGLPVAGGRTDQRHVGNSRARVEIRPQFRPRHEPQRK
jgi:hypothetical protein